MLTQEELNYKYPKEVIVSIIEELRFFVGYYTENNFQVLLVYDRMHSRVVYRSKSKTIDRHKKHIVSFYGKYGIINKPKLIENPRLYEGL